MKLPEECIDCPMKEIDKQGLEWCKDLNAKYPLCPWKVNIQTIQIEVEENKIPIEDLFI